MSSTPPLLADSRLVGGHGRDPAYVWEEGGGAEGELLPGKGLVNGRHLGRRRLEWFTRKERAVFCRDLH